MSSSRAKELIFFWSITNMSFFSDVKFIMKQSISSERITPFERFSCRVASVVSSPYCHRFISTALYNSCLPRRANLTSNKAQRGPWRENRRYCVFRFGSYLRWTLQNLSCYDNFITWPVYQRPNRNRSTDRISPQPVALTVWSRRGKTARLCRSETANCR